MRSKIINTSLNLIGEKVQTFQNGGKIAVICDSNVYDLYYEKCRQSLADAGFVTICYKFPSGESNKNGKIYLKIMNFLAENKLSRSDAVIALGGGVTGDIAGFAAATYLRGIRVIQVPTTLLSMVDSSIGGKTGINLDAGKNLAGAFHMPKAIIHDKEVLETLPDIEWQNGFGEILKMGFIEGGKLLNDIEEYIASKDEKLLGEIVFACIRAKQKIVENDEFDRGSRHILNFGHTIAHAIEKLSNYEVKHGFAAAIGISVMTEISFFNKITSTDTRMKVNDILSKYGFSTDLEFSAEDISKIVRNDKKVKNGTINCVFIEDFGRCIVKNIELNEFDKMLVEYEMNKR